MHLAMKISTIFFCLCINAIYCRSTTEEIFREVLDTPKFITSNETFYIVPGTDLDIVCQVTQSNPNIDIIVTYDAFDNEESKRKIFSVGPTKVDKGNVTRLQNTKF